MTDIQFKAYLRELIAQLEDVLKENPDSTKLKEMIRRLREALES